MKIRFMEEKDADAAAQLEAQLFSRPWTKQDFINAMADKHNIYVVVEENGKVIAYSGLWGVVDEGQITNVAVSKEFQNRGIGYAVITEMLAIAREEGLKSFTLEVRESNQNAIKLYKKLGFMKEGIRKNYYENPTEDALIMWLREPLEIEE